MSTRKKPPVGTYGSAEFKARCLELVDRVKETRTDVIITRHGRPVARLGGSKLGAKTRRRLRPGSCV